ncbi:MAG: OmpA family protein [Thermodesulfobacteriota bacterium]
MPGPNFSVLLSLVFLSLIFPTSVRSQDCPQAWALFRQAAGETDYAARLALFEKAVKLCPDLAEAWNNLADAEEHLGRLDDAVTHYQKALALKPDLTIAHFGLGDVYFKKKEYKKACDAYIEGLRLQPRDEAALRNLGQAEAALQASGGILSAEYISGRLDSLKLMGPAGTRPRIAFQNITFDFDSDRIRSESLGQLKEIGQALKEVFSVCSDQVLLEGHTDNVGAPDYNLNLSQRRAESVRRHLVERHGLDRSRLTTQGLGMSRPVAPNDTSAGRAQNRRVELALQ